jgi:hypothetical protein
MASATLTLTVSSSTGWVNPTNAFVSNNAYASYSSVTTSGTNFYFRFTTNAATLLPANAVITGVRMDVEYRTNNATPQPRFCAGPGDFGGTANPVVVTTTDVVYVFGGPGNTLGAVTRDDVSTASIQFGNNAAGTSVHYIDNVVMYVDWELPKAGNTLFHGENF